MKERRASGSLEEREYHDSPESLIMPYEDINSRQEKITGEKLPDIILELCDNCLWSCMYFNPKGLITKCPICSTEISQIPMRIDETCSIEFSNKRGITLGFDRKSPIRLSRLTISITYLAPAASCTSGGTQQFCVSPLNCKVNGETDLV